MDAGQILEVKQIQEVMEHGEKSSRRGLGWFQFSDSGLEGGGQPSGGRSLGLWAEFEVQPCGCMGSGCRLDYQLDVQA